MIELIKDFFTNKTTARTWLRAGIVAGAQYLMVTGKMPPEMAAVLTGLGIGIPSRPAEPKP